MRTKAAEQARARNIVIIGIAVMAIGAAMTVWETRTEHTLVFQAPIRAPTIEALSVVEITERGWERGKMVVSADEAFLSGQLLETMMAGGEEEYARFADAAPPTGAQTSAERTEQMTAYVDELYARRERNLMAASESAGLMVVLFGVAIIISAVAGEKISKRYATKEEHAAPEHRGPIGHRGSLGHRAWVRRRTMQVTNSPQGGSP